MLLPPPTSPRFPYTTLFRSRPRHHFVGRRRRGRAAPRPSPPPARPRRGPPRHRVRRRLRPRSEEHTSELQSLRHLVCRLLLEKKKTISRTVWHTRSSPIATR